MTNRIGRSALITAALALVISACGGDAAPVFSSTTGSPSTPATTSSTEAAVVDSTTSTSSTTTLPPSGPPVAVVGDTNETVEAVQFLLNCNGYGDLTVDGAFGPATAAVVEAAQTALGRTVTGEPDDELVAELSRACPQSRRLAGDEGLVLVVGNAAPGDPEVFEVALLSGSTLKVNVTRGTGLAVTVRGADGTELEVQGQGTWQIDVTQDYTVEIGSDADPTTFEIAVDVTPGVQETGDWILATDGVTYRGTKLALGDDAQTVIDNIFDFFGHGVRGSYAEFDTDWYTISDPQDMGLRGIFIEGLAFLFFGPDPANPDRPETLQRIRFEGPSDDASGEPRPDNYVTTAEGITVGDTLADLIAAYGDAVDPGSNSSEWYYRYADSHGRLCFYFGASEPSDFDQITEIATECRS